MLRGINNMIIQRLFFLLLSSTLMLRADPPIDGSSPASVFYEDLAKAEAKYLTSMRARAQKANSMQIFRISPRFSEVNAFVERANGFETTLKGEMVVYPIIKSSTVNRDLNMISRWAIAVLPEERLPLTLCEPSYGYAVRFFDAQGDVIYECTICLKCSIASMEFPRYPSQIGVNIDTIKELLKLSGFEPEVSKIEPKMEK
jgi:hypothetical protein